ncbi:hypothetical protein SUGI_0102430 [Cryptomeria japonica]|nr:hypothetical protein SUGI_0102430 [Cryptomeria japonica]
MGQITSYRKSTEVCPQGIRVVQINGRVKEFSSPLKAKDLLLNYPKHFVCCSRDLCAMSATNSRLLVGEEELQMGEIYLMLPFSALDSHNHLAELVARLRTAAIKRAAGQKRAAVKKGAVAKVVQGRAEESRVIAYSVIYEQLIENCGNAEAQMAYKEHLIAKSISWRPGLDTIKEATLIC